jgi:molybdopterin-guanine dinucleotide biosynthesis protein A
MGQDKAALVLEGRSLLQRACDALAELADELVVVGAPGRALPELAVALPLRRVDDAVEGEGPLFGIAAALEAAKGDVAIVVGCDMPYLEPALLHLLAARALEGARLVVPMHDGRPESLCAAWRTDGLPVVLAHLGAGDRAVMSVAADLEATRLAPEVYREADPEGRSFINVNTPAELEAQRKSV